MLCHSLCISLSLSLSLSLSFCTSRQERGCDGCHKERYDAAWNRFRFPQFWNFVFRIFSLSVLLLFLNTATLPILILSKYSHDIPCAILELPGTMPELADKVRIPTLRRTIPEIYRLLFCAEHMLTQKRNVRFIRFCIFCTS